MGLFGKTNNTEINPYDKFLEGLDEVKSKESFESCWNIDF